MTPRRLLFCILLLGLGVRVFGLGAASMQIDEAMSLIAAAQWRTNPHFDVHPPLYLAGLAAWGQVSLSEGWLRLFSVVPSLALVAFFPRIFSRLGLSAAGGLAGAVMLAVSFADLQQAREVRMYAWLGLWAGLHLLALLSGRWRWAVLTLLAACYTHLFGLFLLPLGWLLRRERALLYVQVAVVLAWLTWAIPQMLAHKEHMFQLRQSPGAATLVEAIGRLVGGRVAAFGDPLSLVLGGIALAWLGWRRPRVHLAVYGWALLPWLGLWLLSALTPVQLFEFKYLVWTLPAWIALLVASARPAPLILLWAAVNLFGAVPWLLAPHQWMANWREVADYAARQRLPVVVHPSMMSAPLLYYGVNVQGVDTWQQVQPERSMVWITTPHHPFVVQSHLATGLMLYWRKQSRRKFQTRLPSSEVDVSAWEWVGPQALSPRRENGAGPEED